MNMARKEKKGKKGKRADPENDIDIEEKVANGWLHVIFSIEVQGNDKSHIDKSLNDLIDGFGNSKLGVVLSRKLDKTEEIDTGWYSNNIEVEALIKDYEALTKLSTSFTPATIEILAPKEVRIPANQLQNAMLDTSALISTFAHAAYMARLELKKARG